MLFLMHSKRCALDVWLSWWFPLILFFFFYLLPTPPLKMSECLYPPQGPLIEISLVCRLKHPSFQVGLLQPVTSPGRHVRCVLIDLKGLDVFSARVSEWPLRRCFFHKYLIASLDFGSVWRQKVRGWSFLRLTGKRAEYKLQFSFWNNLFGCWNMRLFKKGSVNFLPST